jgi:copper chaperone CopZ
MRSSWAACHAGFTGMKCGGCVGHVKKILEKQPGVMQVGRDNPKKVQLVIRSPHSHAKLSSSAREAVI